MREFTISHINHPGQTVRLVGSIVPVQMIPPMFSHSEVSFIGGPKFHVVGGQWWYVGLDYVMNENIDWYTLSFKFSERECYTLDEVFDLSPPDMQEIIIWNMDIFRGLR